MAPDKLTRVRRVIRRHYGLAELPTFQQTRDELTNLKRKARAMSLDDRSQALYSALGMSDAELASAADNALDWID